jgi:alkanesulfonate monooxygenase SsuD/methylene tetrahydromethanopterin reductase-like flavin-dependent oxidoreductase (luciferase family)
MLVEREWPDGRDYEVALSYRVSTEGDMAANEWRARREIASYLRVEFYARWLSDLGHAATVENVRKQDDLDAMARTLPDDLVDDLVIVGEPSRCRRLLEDVRRAGATPLVLPAVKPGDQDAALATLAAVAPELGRT